MAVMFCGKCRLPVADAHHDFPKVCECIPIAAQKKWDKRMGWTTIKYPGDKK